MTSRAPPRRLQATCHCGNIRVDFDWPGAWPAIPVRACGCGLCTRHGARWTSHPDGAFRFEVGDPALTTRYRFGSKSADFHVCTRCGAIPIVTSLIEARRYGVLNANTFLNVERTQFAETASNFEGETLAERLARRQRNWMPEAGEAWPR